MIDTIQTDEQLIASIIDGNKQAYRELVTRYQSYVYTIVCKILNHHEESEDVSQDVFVKVYHSLSKFDGRSKFSTWLYRIAVNTAISHRRKHKYVEDVDHVQIEYKQSYDAIKHSEQQRYLQEAFALLKEDDVVVLTLFYLKELSLEEIAEILNIEANNVKVKLFRARKRLAEKMQLILNHEAKSLL